MRELQQKIRCTHDSETPGKRDPVADGQLDGSTTASNARNAMAEKLKELEQREQRTAAIFGDLSDGQESVFCLSEKQLSVPGPVEPESVWIWQTS